MTAKSCRRWTLLASLALFSTARAASAQVIEDVGTRARGMAGAFVAVADDASATWWNPAGLASALQFVDLSAEVAGAGSGGAALAFPSIGLSYYRLKISQIQPLSPIGSVGSSREDNGVVSQFGATFGQSIAQHLVLATTVKLVNVQNDTQADLDVGVMGSFGMVRL